MVSERTVVVLPGANFGPSVPQLFLPMIAAVRRHARAVQVAWDGVEAVDGLTPVQRVAWVTDRVAPHLLRTDPASTLVVAKSLGTCAAGLVAERGLPAIWVTPLLTDAAVVAGLGRATAPFLLVGGTADGWWDGAAARSLTPHVLELAGADHGLFVQGPLRRSVENLARLADACEEFLDGTVWPAIDAEH